MELSEYVRQTLVEVMDGVMDAQEEVREIGGAVSPKRASRGMSDQLVEFEVEV